MWGKLARNFIGDLAQNFSRIGGKSGETFLNFAAASPKLPENSAEKAHHAAQVRLVGHEAAEEDAEGFAVGGPHAARGVVDGFHGFFDEGGEAVELGCIRADLGRIFAGGGDFGRRGGCSGDFVEADGYGLAQVHGGLGFAGFDGDEGVAPGEVVAG